MTEKDNMGTQRSSNDQNRDKQRSADKSQQGQKPGQRSSTENR